MDLNLPCEDCVSSLFGETLVLLNNRTEYNWLIREKDALPQTLQFYANGFQKEEV